ncbi:MAG TPA: hypothetical protein VKH82_08240 [Candidatus Binatia bacterium]|nr:hypothetical protein [Candidatus Binatia bacterium]
MQPTHHPEVGQHIETAHHLPPSAVASRLLAGADALFGPHDDVSGAPPRWLLRYLGVAAILATVIVARRPDMITNPQFWGEDGFIYFQQNLLLGFPRAVTNFYMNFPNVGQRLIAAAGGLVPFAAAPRVYTTTAIAISALCVATFSLPAFRHLVRSDLLRVLWAIAVVSLPFQDYNAIGLFGSPANVGWWVAVWLLLLSFIRIPRQPGRVMFLALGAGLAVFSTPHALVGAPFWVLRGWRAIRRSDRLELAFALTLVSALALCIVVTGDLGSNVQGTFHLSFFDMPPVYLARYVRLVSDQVTALVLEPGALKAARAAGPGAPAGVALVVLASLVAIALIGEREKLIVIVAEVYLFLASLFFSMVGRLVFALLTLESFPARYTIPSGAMLLLAVVTALDGLPRGRLRLVAILLVTGILAWSFRPRFALGAFGDQHWPQYAALLEQKLRARSTAPLTIPINPPWTPILFDERPLEPQHAVPARQPIAVLAGDRVFQQTFSSVCDGLDGIVLHLATGTSSRGRVELSLLDDQGRSVATVSVPRDRLLQDVPQRFYFAPIAGSAGRHYTIVLRAEETDPAVPITVLGAGYDPYPDGRAIAPAATPDLDASFAYSCASTWTGASR